MHSPLRLAAFVSILVFAHHLNGQNTDRDRYFHISSAAALGANPAIGFPTLYMNERGDVAATVNRIPSGTAAYLFPRSAQASNNGSTPGGVVFTKTTLGPHLTGLTDGPGVAASLLYYDFQNTGSTTLSYLRRVDWDGSVLHPFVLVVQGDFFSTLGLQYIGPRAAISDANKVYFYGEYAPISALGKGVFDEARSPIATTNHGFTSFDLRVTCSSDGRTVYRGTGPSGLGIYTEATRTLVASAANGYTKTGAQPGINKLGTVGFFGEKSNRGDIYLWFPAGSTARLAGSVGATANSAVVGTAPNVVTDFTRVSLNDLNQVAFLATDGASRLALYSTNLGAMRVIARVGDTLDLGTGVRTIDSLTSFDGLNNAGQIVFGATVSGGASQEAYLIRVDRAPYQTKVLESPITPSWRTAGTGYLLRSSRVDPTYRLPTGTRTLSAVGCNLTSTVAVMAFHGHDATPLEFQDWLIDRWAAERGRTGERNNRYIIMTGTDKFGPPVIVNDFNEDIIEEYSATRVSGASEARVVRYVGMHDNGPGKDSNLKVLVRELRAGRCVKVRVPRYETVSPPQNYKMFAHYILAYGLLDPNVADTNITADDILVHDPGSSNVRTLSDYATLKALVPSRPQWLEERAGEQRRLYLYESVPTGLHAPAPRLTVANHGQVRIVLKDAQGRRVGVDSAGASYQEIPGAHFSSEESYQLLDEAGSVPERAWETDQLLTRVSIPSTAGAEYMVEAWGVGSGSFELVVSGHGGDGQRTKVLRGTATASAATTFRIRSQPASVESFGRSTPACNGDIVMAASKAPQIGIGDFAVSCVHAPGSASGVLLVGAAYRPGTALLGVDLFVDLGQQILVVPASTNASGASSVSFAIPGSVTSGSKAALQYVWLNTAACQGAGPFSASDALEITMQ